MQWRAWVWLISLIGSLIPVASTAASPRERLLLDFNWRFYLGDASDAGTKFDYPEVKDLSKTRIDEIGQQGELAASQPDPVANNLGADVSFVQPGFNDSGWRQLNLPHDWVGELPFSTNADLKHGFKTIGTNFPGTSVGWYRRTFELRRSDKDKTLWLEFDGVYRNCLVWLNGHCLGRNVSGYSSFYYDINQHANFGGKNELVVRVDASRFEGWFYEGAGIYRHVWLVKTSPLHVAHWGTYVTSDVQRKNAEVTIQTQIRNDTPADSDCVLVSRVLDAKGRSVGKATQSPIAVKANGEQIVTQKLTVTSAKLWSPDSPNLYRLETTVKRNRATLDIYETPFGIRTIAFDADKGFLLNGKPCVVQGTCNHQDHAGVGAAMPDRLQYFRVSKLKEMGSNAYRTSHNPPTPELLDACDELGMLVMDENRRVDTSPQTLDELRRLILRDRNHPGIFIWSLGNEEFALQGTNAATQEAAARIAKTMQNVVHELDPTRPCTLAMNGNWGIGFSTVVDVQGFNYRTRNIAAFRAKSPTQPAIGTETASTRTTRGIYVDDKERGYVAAYGENGVEKAWTWWPYYATNAFTSGGFVWTGFDYRGEPTPYRWPCISSHFGIMDTCAFPKDIYYYYQSWWTDKPVLHLTPHWNGLVKDGQTNQVRCFSNCKTVELFLNGVSLGKKPMETNWFLDWDVPYGPGALSAEGYDGKKLVARTKVETTGAPAAIQLTPDRAKIRADGEDLSIITVAVADAKGRIVPTAANLVEFQLDGPGKIIGVGNGDPSCHEADICVNGWERSVFNGFAQVIVQSSKQSGKIKLTARSADLPPTTLTIRTQASKPRPAVE